MRKTEDTNMILTHLDEECEKYLGAVVPPVFFDSLYVFEDMDKFLGMDTNERYTFSYGRSDNPIVRIIENKVAALEKGDHAVFFAAGMAALNAAIMATCHSGSHIICINNAYGPVREYLEKVCATKFSMAYSLINGDDIQEIEKVICPETALIILESPSSQAFRLCDLKKIAALAKKHNIRTYIDNTYCSPIFQNPLEFGIDIVMHTATKYIGGHSDLLGGVLVTKDTALYQEWKMLRDLSGSMIGPMEAWLILRGLRTLNVRMQQYNKTGLEVAKYLESHPKVDRVYYPGLESHPQYQLMKEQQRGNGSLMSFSIKGDKEKAKEFVDHLQVFKIGYSWGGYESLAEMPFYNADEKELKTVNLPDNLIRIYCGLEGSEAICADLGRAFDAIGGNGE